MANFKPVFTVSEKKILWNLHIAAADKLKKNFPKVKVAPLQIAIESIDNTAPTSKDFEIKVIDNTAFGKKEEESLENKDGKYKVYVLYVLKDITTKPDIKDIKKEVLEVLVEYFTVFCGSALAKKIKDDDILELTSQDDDTSDINRQMHALTGIEALQVEYTIGAKAKS